MSTLCLLDFYGRDLQGSNKTRQLILVKPKFMPKNVLCGFAFYDSETKDFIITE